MPWTSKAARSGVGVPSTTGFDHRLFLRRVDLALPKLHKDGVSRRLRLWFG
jgi:hypothetical protein